MVCTDAALNYISFLSAAFRDQDALHILESRRKIAKEAGSLNAWDLATADVIMQLNREDEAMDIYGRLYNNFTADRDTAQHIDIASSMAEYQMQSGNYAAAEKLWLETVALSAAISDEDSLDYYSRLDDLATYYDRVGRKFQAIQYSQQVFGFRLRMAKDTTSMEYIFFGDALTRELAVNSALSLGRLYTNVGMYDEADPCSLMPWMNHWPCMLIHLSNMPMHWKPWRVIRWIRKTLMRLNIPILKPYGCLIPIMQTSMNGTTWKDNLFELYMRMHQPRKRWLWQSRCCLIGNSNTRRTSHSHGQLQSPVRHTGCPGQTDSALTLYEKY